MPDIRGADDVTTIVRIFSRSTPPPIAQCPAGQFTEAAAKPPAAMLPLVATTVTTGATVGAETLEERIVRINSATRGKGLNRAGGVGETLAGDTLIAMSGILITSFITTASAEREQRQHDEKRCAEKKSS